MDPYSFMVKKQKEQEAAKKKKLEPQNRIEELMSWVLRNYYKVNIVLALGLVIISLTIAVTGGNSNELYYALTSSIIVASIFLLTLGCLMILNFFNESLLKESIICLCNAVMYFINIVVVLLFVGDNYTFVSIDFWATYIPCIFVGILLAKIRLDRIKKKKG